MRYEYKKTYSCREEEMWKSQLRPGVLHICPKGSEHSIINTGTEDLVLFTIVVVLLLPDKFQFI